MSIIIFSKPVRSGKTTALQLWCKTKKNIGGILMPDILGIRKILDIRTGELFDLECIDPGNCSEELIHVGRFYFYKSAFKKANLILSETLKLNPEWLIIDEAGKLELEKKGFYKSVKKITAAYENKKLTGKIILVVRESLCEEIVSFFKIKKYRVTTELP